MKNLIRAWLGINDDMRAIGEDVTKIVDALNDQAINTFGIFHALPFANGVLSITAADAARLTEPEIVQSKSPVAIFLGILIAARQGNSYFTVDGELSDETKSLLKHRGFEIDVQDGKEGKMTHILWT